MSHRSRSMFALLAALLLPLAAVPLSAQSTQTGTLRGTIRDADGLAVPGARVTVTSTAAQEPRSATTDVNGVYVVEGLLPGVYDVTITLAGFAQRMAQATVALGQATDLDTALQVSGTTEQITVVPAAASLGAGMNFTADEIGRLPGVRTIQQIGALGPGVSGGRTTYDPGQIRFGGARAFESLFVIDGVDVNDNLSGVPNTLFIEDAIQETHVLPFGLPAEYGRLAGGVVSAITRHGGNRFSASLRLQLGSDAWTSRTPLEIAEGLERPHDLNSTTEATAGGPVIADRLWFFTAGRLFETAEAGPLPTTGVPVPRAITNRRGEIKLTASLGRQQTLIGSYLTNPTGRTGPSFPDSIDPATVIDSRMPNRRLALTWRGVLSPRAFATVQFAEKWLGFRDAGGSSTSIVDSPFFTLTQEVAHYNAPYFDSTDPEDRDSRQIAGSLSYLLATPSAGSHYVKAGAEMYRSRLVGGNSQSATGFVFVTDYVEDDDGRPAVDGQGRLIPTFVPGETQIEQWIASRGAQLDIRTTSLYVQDDWSVGARLSINLGLRYERVRSEATGDIRTVKASAWMPRLGASYSLFDDARLVVRSTYGHYSGRYTEGPFARNTPVGNPAQLVGIYVGPQGEGRAFTPGFEPENYQIVFGEFPTANVFVEEGLSSPNTREWTGGVGWRFARGDAGVTYVWRHTDNFIEDLITLDGGTTTVTQEGVTAEYQNIVIRNTGDLERRYQGIVLQSRYRLHPAASIEGHWTIELRHHGNFEGEALGEPATTSVFGDYPESTREARHYPDGRLSGFQRNRIRLWTHLEPNLTQGRGRSFLSILYSYDGPTTFSYAAPGVPLTAAQEEALAGYVSLPLSQTLYFDERGTGQFNGSHSVDAAFSYELPVWRTLGPWVRLEVLNVFNSMPLVGYNTTIEPDYDGPVDSLGLPTTYITDPRFGRADSNADFPLPRTFRLGLGFRF